MAKAATFTEIKRRERVTLATLKKSETESFVVDRALTHIAMGAARGRTLLHVTLFLLSYHMGLASSLKVTYNKYLYTGKVGKVKQLKTAIFNF